MKLKIVRGSHEIGGSCIELASGETRIIIDNGLPLVSETGKLCDFRAVGKLSPQDGKTRKLLPPVENLFFPTPGALQISGLLISHAHLDHYGFLPLIQPDIPVHLSRGTRTLIEITADIYKVKIPESQFNNFENLTPFTIGPFTITPFLMDHSSFDAHAFLIESEGKHVLYTGDFRDHGRKPGCLLNLLEKCPKEIDALILEGTSIGREDHKSLTEVQVEKLIIETLRGINTLALFCCSSQNIDRLVTFFRAALQLDRTMVVDLYTARILDALSEFAKIPSFRGGYSNLKVYWETTSYYSDFYQSYRVGAASLNKSPEKYLLLTRQSLLKYLDKLSLPHGIPLIYSLWEGYLKDDSTEDLRKFIETHKVMPCNIHTGGHADPAVLKQVVDTIKPRKVIPFHTMNPEGYHIFGDRVVPVQDGQVLEI